MPSRKAEAEWKGNLPYESDELFVVEADEYDRSFLTLSPTVAVVTNVEADHLDYYGTFDAVRAAFDRFLADAPGPKVTSRYRCPWGLPL